MSFIFAFKWPGFARVEAAIFFPAAVLMVSHINLVQFKYIIRAGETAADDGLPERSAQIEGAAARVFRAGPGRQVFVQPCDEPDPVRAAANMREAARIAMRFGYRLSVQLHKIADIP